MEQTQNESQDKNHDLYKRLDKYLLYLLAGELGYFILLMVAAVVVTILVNFFDVFPNFYMADFAILIPILIYIIALPLNMVGGMASIILNLRTNQKGYPGTGHLLNWIFLMTTGWLFIASLVFLLPSMARGGFD